MTIRKTETLLLWLAGPLLALAAATVMTGWFMHWDHVVQPVATVVPMQFNTALTFFTATLALLAAEKGYRNFSTLLALLVLCMAATIGMQYVVDGNFGIDSLFVKPYLQTRTTHPGRMAPNTAIAFVMYSSALLYWLRGENAMMQFNLMLFANITLMLIGVIALSGYLAKVEAAYSWWGLSDMAVQTAGGLVVLSLCALCHMRILSRRMESGQTRVWLPAYVALAGAVLTLLIAQGMLLYHKTVAHDTVVVEADRIGSLINLELNRFAVRSLTRMQERYLFQGGDEKEGEAKESWQNDAAHFIRDNISYHSIALLDKKFGVEGIQPPAGRESFWQKAADSLTPITDDKAHVSDMLRLEDEPPMVVIYLPLKEGYVAAAYKIEDAVTRIIGDFSSHNFYYTLFDSDGKEIYRTTSGNAVPAAWQLTHEEKIPVARQEWTLDVTLDVAAYQNNGLVLLVVSFGFAFSFLSAFTLFQAGKSRRFQKRLEAILEQIIDGMVTIDTEGYIRHINKASEKIFGYAAAEAIGQKVNILLPRDTWRDDMYLTHALGAIREMEGRKKNGDAFPMEISVAEVKIGKERMYSALIRNITERKEKEQEMMIMRAESELSQFAYVASHDLKAPLRGIDNLALWIAEDLGPALTPQAKEQFALLHNRVARLEKMLEDILRYSRAGRITGNPEPLDVGEMLAVMAEPVNRDGKFKIVFEGAMPTITVHRTPLEQVFSNLIFNAIKHHDKGTGTLTVGVIPRGRYYEFYVLDDGPGIPPKFHAKVFQIFQTLQPRDKKEGIGLGMAIVKKLVEWQGGRVWIESEAPEKRGTAFHFLWRDQAVAA